MGNINIEEDNRDNGSVSVVVVARSEDRHKDDTEYVSDGQTANKCQKLRNTAYSKGGLYD